MKVHQLLLSFGIVTLSATSASGDEQKSGQPCRTCFPNVHGLIMREGYFTLQFSSAQENGRYVSRYASNLKRSNAPAHEMQIRTLPNTCYAQQLDSRGSNVVPTSCYLTPNDLESPICGTQGPSDLY
jgi:hypothetical protein